MLPKLYHYDNDTGKIKSSHLEPAIDTHFFSQWIEGRGKSSENCSNTAIQPTIGQSSVCEQDHFQQSETSQRPTTGQTCVTPVTRPLKHPREFCRTGHSRDRYSRGAEPSPINWEVRGHLRDEIYPTTPKHPPTLTGNDS